MVSTETLLHPINIFISQQRVQTPLFQLVMLAGISCPSITISPRGSRWPQQDSGAFRQVCFHLTPTSKLGSLAINNRTKPGYNNKQTELPCPHPQVHNAEHHYHPQWMHLLTLQPTESCHSPPPPLRYISLQLLDILQELGALELFEWRFIHLYNKTVGLAMKDHCVTCNHAPSYSGMQMQLAFLIPLTFSCGPVGMTNSTAEPTQALPWTVQ